MADKAEKTLEDLFHDMLKDIYFAERQILKALPKMAKGAQSPELKAAFEKHRTETEGQVERLQQVFEIFGKRAQGKTCPAIEGILEEGAEILDEFKDMRGARCRPGVGGAGGRALRDRPLRHAEALGRDARHGGCRQAARPDPRRGDQDGQGADRPCQLLCQRKGESRLNA